MEMSFSELRTKEVVNTADGRNLGKVCDMVFCYPENKILGFVVPGQRSFASKRTDFFIELKNIVKIGDDVILVNVGFARSPQGSKGRNCSPCQSVGHYGGGTAENGYGGSGKPGFGDGTGTPFQNRRSYDEYE